MNPYRKRVWAECQPLLQGLGDVREILDFGCGDGWFATQVGALFSAARLTPLDVKRRDSVLVEPMIYEPGAPLPFADASMDLAYAVDVLHHCHSPEFYLDELGRVSRKYLLIKDHSYRSPLGYAALAILDELGNRRFGIPSPQHYQRGRAWTDHLARHGWSLRKMIDPCHCHVGLLGALTNGLQYLALYQRDGSD